MTAPRWYAAAVLAIGALAAAALVGRPVGLGLSVLLCALIAVAAVAVPPRDGWAVAWWLAAAGLALVASLRAAGWVVWPALLAAVALASLAASGGAGWRAVAAGLGAAWRVPAGWVAVLRPAAAARPQTPALRGAAIAALLLAVFVPLFAGADAAFAHLLSAALPEVAVDRPVARAAVWPAFAGVGGALRVAGRAGPPPARPAGEPRLARLEWLLPLAGLVALFAAFAALQLTTLYGGHDHVIRTAGLTYAEYARQGFAQLIAVAALTLAVVAAAVRWAPDGRLLRGLLGALCALTLVVLSSALTRLGLYEEAYGFTRLRFAAHAQILWLGGVFVLLLAAGALRRTAWLPRGTVALSALGVLAFAIADPDRRIAEHNVERFERTGRIDLHVLAGLGPDAAPALAQLPPRMAACTTDRVRRALAGADGLAGRNLARERARATIGPLPLPDPDCPA